MAQVFDVNNDEVIELSEKLEKLHRSAFPSAVRNTLNNAVYETKLLIPKVTSEKFVTRNKTFFKKMSTFEKAKGFNVDKMSAVVGINKNKGKKLAKNLEAQEVGGMVHGRKLTPHDDARISKNNAKKVRSENYINKIKAHNANKAYRAHNGTRKSKFMSAILSTMKSGKNHMMLSTGDKGMVYKLVSVSQNIRTRKTKIKLKKVYNVRSTKTHQVKASGFMLESSRRASKNLSVNFKKNAEFQFKKLLEK